MTIQTVGIVGYGYVGRAMHELFPEACIYDPHLSSSHTKEDINRRDMALVCVPTAMNKDGSCDVSLVTESIAWLTTPYILIKSTIPPGTTDALRAQYRKRIVFSPEYAGESAYWSPYNWKIIEEPFLILGGDRSDTVVILNCFKKKMGPTKRYFQVDARTAELAKYMENAFYATKVTFCNEFFEIARAFNVDYNEVRELFIVDPRINAMHTLVFEDNRGFGGKCFPKDVNGIVRAAENAGYEPKLLKQVLSSNERFKAHLN